MFLALLIETDLGLTGVLEIPVGAPIGLEDISMGILAAYLEKARPHLVSGDCLTLLINSRGGPGKPNPHAKDCKKWPTWLVLASSPCGLSAAATWPSWPSTALEVLLLVETAHRDGLHRLG